MFLLIHKFSNLNSVSISYWNRRVGWSSRSNW